MSPQAYAVAVALFNELKKQMPHPTYSVNGGTVQDINFCDASAQGYRTIMQYRNIPGEGAHFAISCTDGDNGGHINVFANGHVQYLGDANEETLGQFLATWNNYVIEHVELCTRLGIKLVW